MYPKILCNIASCAYEACFIGQRNKFHLRMKPTCCTSPENTYAKKDNEAMSEGLMEVLKRQGFIND